MAAVTERSDANILPYSPLTPDLVSVTMPEPSWAATDLRATRRRDRKLSPTSG